MTDSDTVRAVFEASYRRLVGQLYGVCGDLTEAEDVVAEAFARAVQHQRTFARLDNPEAWLRTVAVNESRTRYRRRRMAIVRERACFRDPPLDDERLSIVAALRRLPVAQREAIALYYLADLPINQVAEATGAAVGTVKALLSRGRAALAVLLNELPGLQPQGAGPTDLVQRAGRRLLRPAARWHRERLCPRRRGQADGVHHAVPSGRHRSRACGTTDGPRLDPIPLTRPRLHAASAPRTSRREAEQGNRRHAGDQRLRLLTRMPARSVPRTQDRGTPGQPCRPPTRAIGTGRKRCSS